MAPDSTVPADRDAPAGTPPLPVAPAPAMDDMGDEPELRNPGLDPVLRQALASIQEKLLPLYRVADHRAIVSQGRHRLIATLAAATGTLAVLFGIGELGYRSLGIEASPWVPHLEAVFLFACLVSVVLGLTAAVHAGWLGERHKAELCRMLKFRLLVRPELSAGRGEEWRRQFDAETAAIALVEGKAAKEAARLDLEPDPPPDISPGAMPAASLEVLANYYLAKRLDFQRGFYASRVARYQERDRRLRHCPAVLLCQRRGGPGELSAGGVRAPRIRERRRDHDGRDGRHPAARVCGRRAGDRDRRAHLPHGVRVRAQRQPVRKPRPMRSTISSWACSTIWRRGPRMRPPSCGASGSARTSSSASTTNGSA